MFNKKLGIRIFYHFTNGPQDDNGQCYHKSVFSDHNLLSYTKHFTYLSGNGGLFEETLCCEKIIH